MKRRRPPFARVKRWAPWLEKPTEVRWLVPPEERDQHRAKVEEMLEGEEYVDVDAREEIPLYEEAPLHA